MIKLYYTFSNPESETFIKDSLKQFTGKDYFVINRTKNGKPYTADIEFSLSHTDGLTVCVVSENTVGVDCEKIRNVYNKERILSRFLKEKEKNVSNKEFFIKWTAFESCVKFFGEKIVDCPSVPDGNIITQTFELGEFIVSVSSEQKTEIIKENLYGSF